MRPEAGVEEVYPKSASPYSHEQGEALIFLLTKF